MNSQKESFNAGAIHLRWEKPTARGVRYYEVDLHRDLWGEWLLTQAWGRRGTRLGQIRVVPCGSRGDGLARIAAILKRRRQHRYRLVIGTDPDDDNLQSPPARRATTGTTAVPEPRPSRPRSGRASIETTARPLQ